MAGQPKSEADRDSASGNINQRTCTYSNTVDLAFLSVAILSGTIYYLSTFIDLFPGAEFQDWITWPTNWPLAWDQISHALLRNDPYFTRDFSMMYAQTSGSICGPDIRCLNLLSFAPISLSAGLIYILGRNLGAKPAFAASAVLLWWFSAPTASTVAWQATINDRLALLFVLIALVTTKQLIDLDIRWKTVIASNLGIGVAVLIAYNCKESSFFLVPLLVVMLVLFRSGDSKRRIQGSALILLPLLYAIYHNIRYFVFQLPNSSSWQKHATGSSITKNFEEFVLGLMSALPSQGGMLSVGVALGCAAILLVGYQLIKSPSSFFKSNQAILLCLFGLVGSFVIPLRAQHYAFFYIYIPLVFFSLTVFLVLSQWSERLPRTTIWKTVEALFLIGLLSAQFARFEKHLIGWHFENAVFSQNFLSGLNTLHDNISVTQIESLIMVRPPDPRYYHNFRAITERQSIWRYALSAEELAEIGSGPVRAQYASVEDQRELQESTSDDDMAFFDDSMRLVALKSNGRLIRFEVNEASP